MPVKIFFPKISDEPEEFLKLLSEHLARPNAKIMKNPDGKPFCILSGDYGDCGSASELLDSLTGKTVGGVVLRPRLYVETSLLKQTTIPRLSESAAGRDSVEDVVNVTCYSGDVYSVQLKSESEQIAAVCEALQSLYEEYKSNMLTVLEYEELREGQLYCTMYSGEQGLFRVKVTHKSDTEDKLTVEFIDYGNTGVIDEWPAVILELSEDVLVKTPPLCHKCIIDNVRIIDEKRHAILSREVLNRNFKATIFKNNNNTNNNKRYGDGSGGLWGVDFLNFCSVSYRSYLILEGVAQDLDINTGVTAVTPTDNNSSRKMSNTKHINGESNNSNSNTKRGSVMENGSVSDDSDDRDIIESQLAVMTHIESLEEFYIQLANKTTDDNLLLIVNKIDYLTSRLRDQLQYNEGDDRDRVYISKFSGDGMWYRCRVLEHSTSSPAATATDTDTDTAESYYYTVQFIDFGNKEKKYNKKDVKPLTREWSVEAEELSLVSPCCHRCSFTDSLLTGLRKSNIDDNYLREQMIMTEKMFKISYHDSGNNNKGDNGVWMVDNIIVEEGGENFAEKYGGGIVTKSKLKKNKVKESSPLSTSSSSLKEVYRVTNIESLQKIWFQLFSSPDRHLQQQLDIIKNWNKGKVPSDIKPVTTVSLDQLYCAVNKKGYLYRCRVVNKNTDRVIVQFIDSGVYNMINMSSLYPLPSTMSSMVPLARPYRLPLSINNNNSYKVEKKVKELLLKGEEMRGVEVELSLVTDSIIEDVFIIDNYNRKNKPKSLMEILNITEENKDNHCKKEEINIVLEKQEEEINIVVEKQEEKEEDDNNIDEVALEISVENRKLRKLRRMFEIKDDEEGGSILENVWKIVDECQSLEEVRLCCEEVDRLSEEKESLLVQFDSLITERKSKYSGKEIKMLVEKRRVLCEEIRIKYEQLEEVLKRKKMSSVESVEKLFRDADDMLTRVLSILSILGVERDNKITEGSDIDSVREEIVMLRKSDEYREEILGKLRKQSKCSDDAIETLCHLVTTVICLKKNKEEDEEEEEDIITKTSQVPLLSLILDCHNTLKKENNLLIEQIKSPSSLLLKTFMTFVDYLDNVKTTCLDKIIVKMNKFIQLSQYSQSILAITEYNEDSEDNEDVMTKMEDIHKRIIVNRSALRHAVPDLEDAEELDLKERQQELVLKIQDLRRTLQLDLRTSKELTDSSDIRKLMLLKPELQLKNQSIFFHSNGVPIFLWDALYFDMCQDLSSESSSYISSSFCDSKVKIKKINLSNDLDYKITLGNISLFFSLSPSSSSPSVLSKSLSLLLAFLSKTGSMVLYLVLSDFVFVSQLPAQWLTQPLSCIITFFKDLIEQVVTLWHLGFIYGEEDFSEGLLVKMEMMPEENGGDSDCCRCGLPLPLMSIINREKLQMVSAVNGNSDKLSSINVVMRRLGQLLEESLEERKKKVGVEEEEEEMLKYLVCVVKNCGEVGEAETVLEDLGNFINKLNISVIDESNSFEENNEDKEEVNVEEDKEEEGGGGEESSSIEQVEDGGDNNNNEEEEEEELKEEVAEEEEVQIEDQVLEECSQVNQ